MPVQESDSMVEADVVAGDVVVAACDDGKVHAFRMLDDGLSDRPSCGSTARRTGAAEGGDVVCDRCIAITSHHVGADVAVTAAAVREVIDHEGTKGKKSHG